MKKFKKSIGIIMALAMIFALSVPAFADSEISTPGGSSSVPVVLTTEAGWFSATVPTSFPVSVDAEGNVTCATDLEIVNNSKGQIKVSSISVTGKNGWSIRDYATDYSSVKTDAKYFGMYIQGKSVLTDGSCDVSNFTPIDGEECAAITYSASVANQSSAINSSEIADVVITLGWNT